MAAPKITEALAVVEETPNGPRARFTVPCTLRDAKERAEAYRTTLAAKTSNPVVVNLIGNQPR